MRLSGPNQLPSTELSDRAGIIDRLRSIGTRALSPFKGVSYTFQVPDFHANYGPAVEAIDAQRASTLTPPPTSQGGAEAQS